jgi:hypothetical protein
MGIVTETISYALKLWVYNPPWLRVLNVVVVFGLIFGWMSTVLAQHPAWLRFATGAAFGIAYEAANLMVFHAWLFPNNQLAFLWGRTALTFGAGICWGFLPLAAVSLASWLQ